MPRRDAAAFLMPRPRDFVQANYRLRSTPTGSLPTDVDLFRAVSLGLAGTAMPPWRHMLSPEDCWAVVEYIKTFSPRFAETDAAPVTVDLGTAPARTEATVAQGKALYTSLACASCHGETGEGNGPSIVGLVDDAHMKIKPRDFTRPGNFKSGYATKEIVRTILTGFNGTPMVGFYGSIPVEDAWKVAYYVETLVRPAPPAPIARASQNFLARESLGEPTCASNSSSAPGSMSRTSSGCAKGRSWKSPSNRPTTDWARDTASRSADTTKSPSSTARWWARLGQ